MTRWFRVLPVLFALLAVVGVVGIAKAADPNKPHPHLNLIPAFTGIPPLPALTADDLTTLASGKAVLKQEPDEGGNGGRGVGIQDIHATPATIFSKVLNYPMYPQWVDGVYECGMYKEANGHQYVRFVIGKMGIKYEYYIDHTIHTDQNYLTWTLDYTRQSDLDDSVGFWYAQPLADKPGWTRVYYSVAIKLTGWVPGFVEDMLTKRGLIQATEWVKREAEKG